MLPRYRSRTYEVEALLFDGSHESAVNISGRLNCTVACHGASIEVMTPGGRVWAGMGCWVVRDCATRRLLVIDDREFTGEFELVPGGEAEPLDVRSLARTPDSRFKAAA